MNIAYDLNILLTYIVNQFKMIFPYWISGVVAGSLVSVFVSGKAARAMSEIAGKRYGFAIALAAASLGALSPVCMYGTVPLIIAFGKKNIPQHLLASFMISSILINPNLFIFSFALGIPLAIIRLLASIIAGIAAGAMVFLFFRKNGFFYFGAPDANSEINNKPHTLKSFAADINRGIVKTAPYFFAGILLTSLFEMYVPKEAFNTLFGTGTAASVIIAASLGVPMYVCGGGTIPLLKSWLDAGMSNGAAVAFMIAGAATKLTNLSAVKIILKTRNFLLYLLFVMMFSFLTGLAVDTLYALAAY